MLAKLSDNTLLATAAVLVIVVGLFIMATGELHSMAGLLFPFPFFVEYTNRRDRRASEEAIEEAFACLNQVQNGKLWMGIEAYIVLRTPTDAMSWELLCRTQRGLWFVTVVTMSGVSTVEGMTVREISASDAAKSLRNRTDLYFKYFGRPTVA